MPDPVVFLKAVAASGIVSAIVVATFTLMRRSTSSTRTNTAWILGIAVGAAVGCRMLGLAPHWPPTDGLDRFLLILLPATVVVELAAGFSRVPRSVAWVLRVGLAAASGRILLHGSSYLDGSASDWPDGQIWAAISLCAVLLSAVWMLLARLWQRSGGISISLAVSQTCVAAGMALMLSSYLIGGQAALPLAAGLAGATIGLRLVNSRAPCPGAIGIGVLSLFGVLVLGRFFGELSSGRAVAIFLAPLLCWATELPVLRHRKPWVVAAVRLGLVALPLAIVLFLAQRDFARNSSAPAGDGYEGYES